MTRRRLAQVAAMALLAGCGGGGGGTPLTETAFCAQKAEAECQVTDRCVTDKNACLADRKTFCDAFVVAAKANTKRFFVPGNVSACIGKTMSVYAKAAPITPTDLAEVDDVCQYVFQGKGEVNVDNCDTKYDCAGRVICDKTFCTTQKNVTSTCGNPGDTCPTGNYCAENNAGVDVCTEKGDSGDTCSATLPCREALRCAGGVCTDRVAAAGTCTSNDDCVTAAPYCDPIAGNKCALGLTFATGSRSCDDFGGTGTGPGTGGSGGASGGAGGSGGTGGAGGRGGTGGSGGGGGAGGSGGSGGGAGAGGSGGSGGSGGGAGAGGSGGSGGGAGAGGSAGSGG